MSVPSYKFQDSKQGIQISVNTINTDLGNLHDSFLHQGHEDKDEELIRVVSRQNPLGRLSSPACSDGKVIEKTFSMRADLEDEKQRSPSSSSSGIRKAMKRAFSKRASSASAANDVYCRIDHQYDTVPVADDENTIMVAHSTKESDNVGNKIIEASRRFFGF
ncbi:hypothetical protein ES319_D09G106400v1 [Gossypium barbadense]|uniref:Uncharacterized protein n=3 Tax=Gossypium TaxID=3633 RepID=A0A5J5Q1E9_GOSBA|nr:hypothetical protein ES319_D09G106400v1 [Gossypium barbadense]TYG53574.1 hypothetical protein ES288_D09G120200v1 [Gossypium darwinii]TYH53672.1 hypothetical protein ES332_D09G116100v1 [Gossypium tomentosum]